MTVGTFFENVDKKVGFDEDLVVDAVDVAVGVMMSDQIFDALDLRVAVAAELAQDCLGDAGPLLLLILAVPVAVFGFGLMDANVVENGRRLENELRLFVQPFQRADCRGQIVDLDEMLNAPGVAAVIANCRSKQARVLRFISTPPVV